MQSGGFGPGADLSFDMDWNEGDGFGDGRGGG